LQYVVEAFTPAEQTVLRRHVTNVDGPVFALVGLPETTRAALFARYSRSSKSLRRLLLDEFIGGGAVDASPAPDAAGAAGVGEARARDLFGRVLAEYGDDSVAQLAGVHLACEQASQLLCKAIEWGRLAGYLEQSTRYIPYTDRRDGGYRYHRDPAVESSGLAATYTAAMDGLFDAYAALLPEVRAHLDRTLPEAEDVAARRRAIRALSLDLCRGLLPAGTVSNVGVFASPQAYEQMVLRLRAHPLPEARSYAELIAGELRTVVPEFLTRLDRPDRGGVWADYLRDTAANLAREAALLPLGGGEVEGDEVRLLEWEEDGEERVIAASLFPHGDCSAVALRNAVQQMTPEERERVFAAAVGERRNRRHRPGRAFEHATYTFEIVADYGAFRDLQRHRMLTMQWQRLSPDLGYAVPAEVDAAGLGETWRSAVAAAEGAHQRLRPQFPEQAGYLVTLGHRVRWLMRLNAREAMHMIELRTSPQGHPAYVRICREMHGQIRDVAGHRLIAAAMRFVGSEDVHLPRYAAEAARGMLPPGAAAG